MKNALSHRLQQARERLFVGRAAQIDPFARALAEESWLRAIWHVHGLGGIGKTTLLQRWKRQAQDAGVLVVTLDGRDFEPSPSTFVAALREALSEPLETQIAPAASLQDLCAAIGCVPSWVILQIDTLERLAPLDYFWREKFVPLLPENAVLMLAGREPLPLAWRGDAALWEQVASFALTALSPFESRDYLEKRGIEARFQAPLLAWTHGHPLALSLAADVYQQHAGALEQGKINEASPAPGDLPQIVGPLLEHLMREVPTPAHRAALEACAIVRGLTQELLAEMLADLPGFASDLPDYGALFEWLRGLSMLQSDRYGLFPHDIAREMLVADLRFRTPAWHTALHRRAREHYLRGIQNGRGAAQERAILDCIYLHRLSPVVGPYLRWNDTGLALETAREADFPALLAMVEKHEGAAARDIAAAHFAAQPEGAIVVREPGGAVQGFVFQLALERADESVLALDSAARRASEWLKGHAPLRNGEVATLFRFWMDESNYQGVGATQSLIFVQAVRHYITTPHLAFTFFPCADAQFWSDGFAYADLGRLPEADFELGHRSFGVFGHDWRARPVLSWLELLSQREMQTVAPAREAPDWEIGEKFEVLDEAQWLAATQDALRSGGDGASLKRSRLLDTALVHARARQMSGNSKEQSLEARAAALRDLLGEAIAEVGAAPRHAKSHRALELCFGRAALTQEAAAAAMDVSHSSLRRYLGAGVALVALWLQERDSGREENQVPIAKNEHDLNWF